MTKRESTTYTLYGDLDGMSVRDLIALLEEYPEDARVDVRSKKKYGYGGWTDEDQEFFVVQWDEEDV